MLWAAMIPTASPGSASVRLIDGKSYLTGACGRVGGVNMGSLNRGIGGFIIRGRVLFY